MKQPFRKLAEEFSDRVYTFAFYSLRSREEAEDVTQEVLVKLWQHAENIDPGKRSAWVMRVARNAVIDAKNIAVKRGLMEVDTPHSAPAKAPWDME